MVSLGKRNVSIYVDRSTGQWIVRDPDGNFWVLPVGNQPWTHRQPLQLDREITLEQVPGHYKYLLELPF